MYDLRTSCLILFFNLRLCTEYWPTPLDTINQSICVPADNEEDQYTLDLPQSIYLLRVLDFFFFFGRWGEGVPRVLPTPISTWRLRLNRQWPDWAIGRCTISLPANLRRKRESEGQAVYIYPTGPDQPSIVYVFFYSFSPLHCKSKARYMNIYIYTHVCMYVYIYKYTQIKYWIDAPLSPSGWLAKPFFFFFPEHAKAHHCIKEEEKKSIQNC